MTVIEKAQSAKKAAPLMSALTGNEKDAALKTISAALNDNRLTIFEANKKDLDRAMSDKLDAPLIKRLKFQDEKLADVIKGIESTVLLDDPCNSVVSKTLIDDGLELRRVTTSIGVIGMIFESRPDALVQIATLCLKSGNCIMLKGGSEASETNKALAEVIRNASVEAGIPDGWIQLVETRDDVSTMLELDSYIDLLIPRGSNEFVKYIMNHTQIPVMGHADGICHVYIDSGADIEMAVRIAKDSKTQYVAVCNAAETLLVNKEIAVEFLPKLKEAMHEVTLVGCPETRKIIDIDEATEEDWRTEYLDYKLSIKIVDSLDTAINHINFYGSGHTDAIVTKNTENAERFMNLVDSADVFWNCSTRFADGYRYGLGAEVGISTSKIHARGPVGLDGLVIYKWKMYGSGQIVADYSGTGGKEFKHKRLM